MIKGILPASVLAVALGFAGASWAQDAGNATDAQPEPSAPAATDSAPAQDPAAQPADPQQAAPADPTQQADPAQQDGQQPGATSSDWDDDDADGSRGGNAAGGTDGASDAGGLSQNQ